MKHGPGVAGAYLLSTSSAAAFVQNLGACRLLAFRAEEKKRRREALRESKQALLCTAPTPATAIASAATLPGVQRCHSCRPKICYLRYLMPTTQLCREGSLAASSEISRWCLLAVWLRAATAMRRQKDGTLQMRSIAGSAYYEFCIRVAIDSQTEAL